MSLNSLSSTFVRHDLQAAHSVPHASADSAEPQDVQNAVSALVEYLPAETITIYLGLLTAVPALQPHVGPWVVYAFCAILTPVLGFLIYAGKRKAAGLKGFTVSDGAIVWPLTAATVAFLAWGLTVEGGPSIPNVEEPRVAAVAIAAVVSGLLGVLGRVFGP